ncbi:MAG: NADH-quinone oxidoreductase subunit M [Phototrophicales bacterium]|nr:MAG: NADH-quinone oxidoreductase subunit M [Phototrophicales bacterium]
MVGSFPFPILSAIVFVPIVAGVLILFINGEKKDLIRGIALTSAVIVLALSLGVYFGYRGELDTVGEMQDTLNGDGGELVASQMFEEGLAFQERITWIESLGISYHVGADGLNAPMILLTGMVAVAGVLISWQINDRTREFMAFFLLLVAGVYGVFIAIDLFTLFFFYELAIFPMYLLIAGWGWVETREYAAMKLTLYILVGSVIALVGVLVMYFTAGDFFAENPQVLQMAIDNGTLPAGSTNLSFDMTHIMVAAEAGAFNLPVLGLEGLTIARLWFPFVFLGFGVLAGVFPFHNWSPDGHVAAPTAVSMIHAGVLMKLGAYAALRVGVQLLPEGAQTHLPWIVFLTLINVVYGAFIAFRQRDFKYVIGFSSVSHMGLVSMGFATMNLTGMTGAGLQMFSHGAMTALFFGCVGMVYDRAHTRDIPSLGGFIRQMPWVGVAFIVGGLTSMGMPGFSGFIAEFPIFVGMWNASERISLSIGNFALTNYYSVIVILAALGIVITAAYVLRVTGQVFFGEFNRKLYPEVGDIAVVDRAVLILLGAPLIILGVWPTLMSPMIELGLGPVLAMMGGS